MILPSHRLMKSPRRCSRSCAQVTSSTTSSLRRYRWDQRYTTDQYADLHRTYSGWLAMPEAAGEALLADICAFIDSDYGGHIVSPLVITLLTARRI